MDAWSASPFVPDSRRLDVLARASRECTGCPLHGGDVQTVFGEGARTARLVLVGEQPGDKEDRRGHPFVGPAGRVLWECVDEAGIDRADIYVTNAVKHFKHEDRGKRRLHKKPTTAEVEACHPWLQAELRAVDGKVVVAMGAVAARAVFGRAVAVVANRGRAVTVDDHTVFVTYHPSAMLRVREESRAEATAIRHALVDDLRAAAACSRARRS